MLHVEDSRVRSLLFRGNFGLERESLRVTRDGFLAQTPHPFPNHPNILCDFSENQLEINTGVSTSPQEAVAELEGYDRLVQRTTFAYGTVVTVNFGETPFALPEGGTLAAGGYLVR